MRFLVDAQLPRRLCDVFSKQGLDAMHTLDLPERNATEDSIINEISVRDQRVVITKDTDFFHSHLLHRRPWKFLLVKTGNISSLELCNLFTRNLP